MTRRPATLLAPLALTAVLATCVSPPPAKAFDPTKPICSLAGLVSGLAGKICSAARHAGTVLKAGQKLLTGHIGGAVETVTGSRPVTHAVTTAAALVAASIWVADGARALLHHTAGVISSTTRPELQSTWFSATYWRMAGISALLTLPFLFAAAIQALLRSDLALLIRSALGYLPLGFLGVSIAAPVTQLLLAASDELSALVFSASGFTTAGFSHFTGGALLASGFGASTFPLFFVGLLAVAATLTLWIELLIRAAAVYVIVLMLPLFFAAFVWPARRIWAVRAVEVLVALILSKFAIVAVLALGAAALGHTVVPSITEMLAGTTLVLLAAFTPWAVLRLLPLHELASSVEGLRGGGLHSVGRAEGSAESRVGQSAAAPAPEEGLGPVDGGPGFAARTALENMPSPDGSAAANGVGVEAAEGPAQDESGPTAAHAESGAAAGHDGPGATAGQAGSESGASAPVPDQPTPRSQPSEDPSNVNPADLPPLELGPGAFEDQAPWSEPPPGDDVE